MYYLPHFLNNNAVLKNLSINSINEFYVDNVTTFEIGESLNLGSFDNTEIKFK